jgi:hypothetical protein
MNSDLTPPLRAPISRILSTPNPDKSGAGESVRPNTETTAPTVNAGRHQLADRVLQSLANIETRRTHGGAYAAFAQYREYFAEDRRQQAEPVDTAPSRAAAPNTDRNAKAEMPANEKAKAGFLQTLFVNRPSDLGSLLQAKIAYKPASEA